MSHTTASNAAGGLTMIERRCGTCVHWTKPHTMIDNSISGYCKFPVKLPRKSPRWLKCASNFTPSTMGNCPCWSPRASEDGGGK